MKKQLLSLIASSLLTVFLFQSNESFGQCAVSAVVYPQVVCAGDNVTLAATGGCGRMLAEDFEAGMVPAGWYSSSPPQFTNPCGLGPVGVYFWANDTASSYRSLETTDFDASSGNCSVIWYMRYGASFSQDPCAKPDHVDKGVSLQWSDDGGGTWTTFPGVNHYPEGQNHYTNNGGPPGCDFLGTTTTEGTGGQWHPHGPFFANMYNDLPQLPQDGNNWNYLFWHKYKSPVPSTASSGNTRFRWVQFNHDGYHQDTWGVDEISVVCPSDGAEVLWSHGPTVLNPPSVTLPQQGGIPYDTCFTVTIYDSIYSATDTVCVTVNPVPDVQIGYDWIQSDIITYTDETIITVLPGTTVNRNWDFGTSHADPTTSSQDTVTVTYYQPGSYTTTLSISHFGCMGTKTLIANITSIEEIEKNNPVKIFPSPASDHITVQLPDDFTGSTQISIHHINGALVKKKEVNQPGKNIHLDLNHLSAGSYIVRTDNNNRVWSHKITVAR